MNRLFKFLGSNIGRAVRVILGMFILAFGFEKNPIWVIVGIVPLLAGVFDVCVFAPLFGMSFEGRRLRRQLKKKNNEDR